MAGAGREAGKLHPQAALGFWITMKGRPQAETMTRMLVITGYYLPGYKAGGPIRTLSNLVERLGDELAFWPGYGALLAASTSPYVQKVVIRG